MKLDKKEFMDTPEFQPEPRVDIQLDTQIKSSFEVYMKSIKKK